MTSQIVTAEDPLLGGRGYGNEGQAFGRAHSEERDSG